MSSLANPVETVHLSPLIILHHLLVLSPLKLPHQLHNWTEQEYILWLEKHQNEKERLALLEACVDDQVVTLSQGSASDKETGVLAEEYVKLVKEILVHARHEDVSPAAT